MKSIEKMRIYKYIKKYKVNSIFVKNFIVSFLIVLIPIIVVNVLIFNYFVEKTERDVRDMSLTELKNVKDNLDKIFIWVDKNSDFLINDSNAVRYMFNNYNKDNAEEVTRMNTFVVSELNKIKMMEKAIQSVYLYSYNSDYIIGTDSPGYLDRFYDPTVKDLIEHEKASNQYRNISVTKDVNGTKIIREYMQMIVNGYNAGVIIVNINYLEIQRQLKDNMKYNQKIEIEDNNGASIITVDNSVKKNISQLKSESIISGYNKFRYSSSYSINTRGNIVLLFVVTVIGLLFAILLAVFITYKTCMPIGELIEIFDNPKKWLIQNPNVSSKMFGEIKMLMEGYLDNVFYSYDIEQKLSNRLVELKQAQLDALMMQISPHFLFNTLQIASISAFKLTGNENDAVYAIELTSKILKYSLYSNDNTETVENEIAYTKAYIELQNIRYIGRVKVNFEIEEDILKKSTVKLIVQPLVENAYAHGIIPYKKTGQIDIKAYSENNTLLIEVSDDGVGLSKDKMEEIRNNMKSHNLKKDKSIGICNINRRIQLLFGEDYGVFVDGEYTNGAKFVIKQPLSG